MGNQVSNKTETIGFHNTNVNNYSSTLPGKFKISKEINKVINNLPLADVEQNGGAINDSEESLGLNDIFKKINNTDNDDINTINNNISDTSPFISSEMYNFLMKGGAKKTKPKPKPKPKPKTKSKSKPKPKSKPVIEETSITIDSSSDNELSGGSSEDKKLKYNKKNSDNEASYISSSAHTENTENTDDTNDDEDNITVSKTYKGKKQFNEISSVNTSDIRLITE